MTNDSKRTPVRGGLKNALALGVAALGLGWSTAHAQAQPATQPTPDAAAANDEIVITGVRPLAESEAAALKVQRESDTVVSVLSADAIGRLPDQNVAFAIGRLPGISLQRDQGQARYVNLRGSPVYWTTLSFDGLNVVSPEGRSTRFDNIPSALASQIVVTKAITPDLPADTVAGNVDIRTRNAFDYEGFTLFGNAALGYVELGGGEENDASLVYADRFLDGKLGLLLQGSFYRRNMVTDNWETDPYLLQRTVGQRFAREYENKPYRLTRQNQSLSFRADYEFNDDNQVFFSGIWTQYSDEELRNNYIFRFDQSRMPTSVTVPTASIVSGACATTTTTLAAGAAVGNTCVQTATGPVIVEAGARFVPGNTPQQGVAYALQLRNNTNSLESDEDTYIATLGGEHRFFDWDIDWRANYVFTSDGRDAPALPNFRSPTASADRPSVAYDFRNGDQNTVALYRTVVNTNGTLALGERVQSIDSFRWDMTDVRRREGADLTTAWTGKIDAERDFELLGNDVTVKTGLIFTDREKKSREKNWFADATALTNAGVNLSFNQFALRKSYLGELPLGYSFSYHSKQRIDNFTADLVRRGIMTRDTATDLDNFFITGERIFGGYLMGTVEQDWGNIVFGARVENIKNDTLGIPLVSGVRRVVTTSKDETLVYPSVNVNVDLSEEVKLRFGVSNTASRPDFDDLSSTFSISDSAQTITGGNPNLETERQTGIDMYLEWYMEPEGFLSAGIFYKSLSDVLATRRGVYGLTDLNVGTTDRSSYTFITPANVGNGEVSGVEFFYSQTAQKLVDEMKWPDWLGGFGVRVGATWISSQVRIPEDRTQPFRTAPLLGTSDETYNLQFTYEKYDLSVRLAYQYRTPWGQSYGEYRNLGGVNVPVSNGDVYWDTDDELDLSVRYRLSDNYEIYFDGVNLLDGAGRRFADSSLFPIEYEKFGRRFIAGVRFNY